MALGRRAIKRFKSGESAAQIADAIVTSAFQDLQELDAELARIAEGAAEGVRRGIQQQAFEHEPNTEAYAAWKRRHGKDERVLVRDGDYLDAIVVIKEAPLKYRITVKDGVHKASGLPYSLLSRYLEHGTLDGIPARPHFAPAREYTRTVLVGTLAEFKSKQRRRSKKKREPLK